MTDEAKRCVAALRWSHLHDDCSDKAYVCPVVHGCVRSDRILCDPAVAADLIESLSAELGQTKRERDAAVEDLRKVCQVTEVCFCCKSHNTEYTEYVSNDCMDCIRHCNWQWRGVKEVPHD